MRIEKSVRINTAPDKVWKVFTNRVISKKMGCRYKTDWTPGSFSSGKVFPVHRSPMAGYWNTGPENT